MQAQDKRYYTSEEYLEFEVNSELRHEYIDGEIVPMTGAMPNHNLIAGNILSVINFSLRREDYFVFGTDQRLWIPQARIHTYPDVMVVSAPLQLKEGGRDTVTNPQLIVEVLSKSTRSYDKDQKFAAYRTIPSFQEYILADQYSAHVEHYLRVDEAQWTFREYQGLDGEVALASVPVQLMLTDVYAKVTFEDLRDDLQTDR
ncbi:MAG: Uma2 family endonuclease [Phormidesmis sp.]